MSYGRDGDDSSANDSLTAPPDAPSTEQYQPVNPRRTSHSGGAHAGNSRAGAGAVLDTYHARATSFNSETDGHDDDEDTLTMPVPTSVHTSSQHNTPTPPLQHQRLQQDQHVPLQQRSGPSAAQMQRVATPPHAASHSSPLPLQRSQTPPQPSAEQQQGRRVVVSPSRTGSPPLSLPPRSPPRPSSAGVAAPTSTGVAATAATGHHRATVVPPQPQFVPSEGASHVAAATAAPMRPPPAVRSNIVDSSGFYYSTRQAHPAAVPRNTSAAATAAAGGGGVPSSSVSAPAPVSAPPPPPPPLPSPPTSASPSVAAHVGAVPGFSPPSPTPVMLLQQQQQQQRRHSPQPQQEETLILPAPYHQPDTASGTASHAAAMAQQQQQRLQHQPTPHPRSPSPTTSRSPSTSQWQLGPPQDNFAPHHRHSPRGGHASGGGGAIFEYASEAVNTLEQQYGDALQRLTTMHRLYDRLDAQNKTLEAEVARLRRTNECLTNGVAFSVYNSVRQVKHEMKLLRQYVAVLFTGFRNSMASLQQVVEEDVPRLLGRDSAYTALLPYGAQGRLRPMETRVSVGRGAHPHNPFAPAPLPLTSPPRDRSSPPPQRYPHPHSVANDTGKGGGGGVSAAAELQLYQPDYWWNAMSPQPLRPPSPLAEANGAGNDGDVERGSANRTALFSPDRREDGDATYAAQQQQQQAMQDGYAQGTVSFQAYRQVQTALAEAQRRVVELEQLTMNQQADFEARVAQLKTAHKAREARLTEELALLKRIEPITVEGDYARPVAEPSINGAPAPAGNSNSTNGPSSTLSVDVQALSQLLASLQQQQQQQQQQQSVPNAASAFAGSTGVAGNNTSCGPADRTLTFSNHLNARAGLEENYGSDSKSDRNNDDDDDGMVDSRDPCSYSATSNTSNEMPRRDGDEDTDYDFYYGNGDVRQSHTRTARRVLQATALGRNRPHTVSGDDGRLHQPDRHSRSAAARRAECARQVLGERDSATNNNNNNNTRGSSRHANPRSLAYDRLVDRHVDTRHAAQQRDRRMSPQGALRGRSQRRGVEREEEAEKLLQRGTKLHGGAHRPRVDLQTIDPAVLQSVLEQLSSDNRMEGSGNRYGYAAKASQARAGAELKTGSKSDRLAQGLWAQEMLRERNFI